MTKTEKLMMILSTIFTISFAGCVNDEMHMSGDANTMLPTETIIESEGSEGQGVNATEIVDEDETEENIIAEPQIFEIQVVDGFSDIRYTEEGKVIYDFTSKVIEANLSEYPETATAIENFFYNKNTEIYNRIDVNRYYEECEWWGRGMDYHMNIEKKRMDNKVISFLYGGDYFFSMGTMDVNEYYEGATFDTVSGQRLGLEDIVNNVEEFKDFADEYITYYFNNMSGFQSKYQYRELGIYEETGDYSWYFDEGGIEIICTIFTGGFGDVARENIGIPYEVVQKYLKEEYMPEKQSDKMQDRDLYDILYPGVTKETMIKESGLSAEQIRDTEDVWQNDWKIFFTDFGSAPHIPGIEMNQYVNGISIGGCKVGMTIDEAINALGQYGFTVKEESTEDYSYCELINEAEWKFVRLLTFNGAVIKIEYGVYENEEDFYLDKGIKRMHSE